MHQPLFHIAGRSPRPRVVEVGHHNVGSAVRKGQTDAVADSPGSTSHYRDPATQTRPTLPHIPIPYVNVVAALEPASAVFCARVSTVLPVTLLGRDDVAIVGHRDTLTGLKHQEITAPVPSQQAANESDIALHPVE